MTEETRTYDPLMAVVGPWSLTSTWKELDHMWYLDLEDSAPDSDRFLFWASLIPLSAMVVPASSLSTLDSQLCVLPRKLLVPVLIVDDACGVDLNRRCLKDRWP